MYQKRLDRRINRPISVSFFAFARIFFPLFSPPFPQKIHKKAQVTIFIILGLVLLISVALVLLLQSQIISFKTDEIIPTEKGKVEGYITSCIQQAGEDALFQLGTQGGYIQLPTQITNDALQYLRLSPNNVLPYWAYGPTTRIPPLTDIKKQIDQYIEAHTKSCLLDLQPFQQTYNLVEKSPIASDTNINQGNVLFNVHWDIEVQTKAGEKIAEIIQHQAESPIKLKKAYDTAVQIVQAEMSSLKIEDLTQDLIALEHPKLPVNGLELSCTKKTWDPQVAEQTLKELLHLNLRELRIKGTEFVEFPDTLPYYQNHYVWNIGDTFEQSKINVAFNFDDSYPFNFAITPLAGGKMQSSQFGGSQYLSLLCIQQWKFTYDVVYPVSVRIKDETTGYNFNIAFTVHLLRNIPNRGEISTTPSLHVDTITDENYCNTRTIPMSIKTYELIDNNQGVYERQDLDNVNITFTCIRYNCHIGKTSYDPVLNYAGFTTNYPYCPGGILRATKPGYKESWQRTVTTAGKSVELNLAPLYDFPLQKIKILKHELINNQLGPAKELSPKDTALIKLTYRTTPLNTSIAPALPPTTPSVSSTSSPTNSQNSLLPSSADQPFHEINLVKTGTPDEQLEQQQSLQFLAKADFTYDLEIDLFNQENFIGGYKKSWTPSWDQLSSANQITLHLITKEKASEQELYDLLLNLDKNSLIVPQPEIK